MKWGIWAAVAALLVLRLDTVFAQETEGPGVGVTDGGCYQAHCNAMLNNLGGPSFPSGNSLSLAIPFPNDGGSNIGLGCSAK